MWSSIGRPLRAGEVGIWKMYKIFDECKAGRKTTYQFHWAESRGPCVASRIRFSSPIILASAGTMGELSVDICQKWAGPKHRANLFYVGT